MEKVTWMGWGRHQGSQGQECDQVYMGQGCLVQLAMVQGQGQGKERGKNALCGSRAASSRIRARARGTVWNGYDVGPDASEGE